MLRSGKSEEARKAEPTVDCSNSERASGEEACKLIEAGFEYVCDFNGNKIFRKRK